MNCPKCNSNNIITQIVQTGGKTKKHGNGIGGPAETTCSFPRCPQSYPPCPGY